MMRITSKSIFLDKIKNSNSLELLNSAQTGNNTFVIIYFRKRMTIIVRTPDNKIKVLCKGADSII